MKRLFALPAILLCLPAAMCSPEPIAMPSDADIEAIAKPRPAPESEDILDDATANAVHEAAKDSWADKVHSAGLRVCRYFERMGADVECE